MLVYVCRPVIKTNRFTIIVVFVFRRRRRRRILIPVGRIVIPAIEEAQLRLNRIRFCFRHSISGKDDRESKR
jgi:hypothetical protein